MRKQIYLAGLDEVSYGLRNLIGESSTSKVNANIEGIDKFQTVSLFIDFLVTVCTLNLDNVQFIIMWDIFSFSYGILIMIPKLFAK